MVQTVNPAEVATLPLAPRNPLPYFERLKTAQNFHTGPEKLRDAGGPVTRHKLAPAWIFPELVVTTSPQGIHDVLDRPHTFVDKGLPFLIEQQRLLGDNLFNVEYDKWLPRRRAMQRVFTKNRVARYADNIAEATESIFDDCDGRGVVDLDELCHSLTLRALGRSVLGLDLDEHVDEVADAMNISLKYVTARGANPVRVPNWLPTPARRRARAAAVAMHNRAQTILDECRTDPAKDAALVRALIEAEDPNTGQPLSDSQIRSELIAFMLAGHDTTSTTLTYALWATGRNPDVQDRLAAETAQLGERRLTPDDLPHLSYAVQVLHEALRLCPPAPAMGRRAVADVDVDGYRVTEGSFMIIGIYAMHRDPALWDNPLIFDPDRFSPDKFAELNRWQFLPFGGGPRGCIGSHFAMLEATLALATIVNRHRIEALDADFPVALPFTMIPKGPIPARVHPR